MRNTPFWWVLLGFMLLVDLYFFQALKLVTGSATPRTKTILFFVYWGISVASIVILLVLPYLHFDKQTRFTRTAIFSIIVGLFFAKLIACLFFLIDDIRRLILWITSKFQASKPAATVPGGDGISRSAFLSWAGMIAGSGMFGTLIYGFGNKYRYQVKRVRLAYPNLPAAFKGFKIVHISDIHCGSFDNTKAVLNGIKKIMHEKPDVILFTGDLVNNETAEMDGYMEVFNKLYAPMGVYSTLGNHDYGDYRKWDTIGEKEANLVRMKEVHATLGWRLLMNEHVVLEKGSDKIALIGVENWSAKARFPKYGNIQQAHDGSEDLSFKILMTHDPSHWKGEILEKYPDIDLTLSGHTHGMQFGVEVPGFKWSPVQYMFKEWAGLYQIGAQRLYVNRGFGFIGYPGRVGILPEITVIELI